MLGLSGITFVQAQTTSPPEDPLALGAWLYGGYCVGCHGSYDSSIVGESLEPEVLRDAISGKETGCQEKWGILQGGPLTRRELDALVVFIQAWLDTGGAPDLPALPPFPTFTPEPSFTPDTLKPTQEPTPTSFVETDPEILLIINGNPVALGARLYTRRCYRCHLSYQFGRMAIGMEEEKLKRSIQEGKVGTSMPAFDWRQGGDLKSSEINAIVAYLLAWEKLGSEPALPEQLFIPPTPDPQALKMQPLLQVPAVTGRLENGLVVYGEFCQDCHGPEGLGAAAPNLHQYWHSVRADLTIRSIITQGVTGTAMPAWGEKLSDEQVNSLVALILEWSLEVPDSEFPPQPTGEAQILPYFAFVGFLLIILPAGWLWLRKPS